MAVDVKVDSHIEDFLAAYGIMEPAALEAIGLKAEAYAKMLCPVGTPESTGIKGYKGGTLRNSISHTYDLAAHKAYIGTNIEYAPYVELGTRRMKARPYLKPAATEHGDEYREIMKRYMKSGG